MSFADVAARMAERERLLADAEETRQRVSAMYGLKPSAGGQLGGMDLATAPPPVQVSEGVRPPQDEMAISRMLEASQPMAVPSLPPTSGSPMKLPAALPAAAPIGLPASPGVGAPGAAPMPFQGSPLEGTLFKIRQNFRNLPSAGLQWMQQTFGLSFDEARQLMNGQAPSPEALGKIQNVARILQEQNQQIELPQTRLGTHTADAITERELTETFKQQGAAGSPLEQPAGEIGQSVQEVGLPITQDLIRAGARGAGKGSDSFTSDEMMKGLLEKVKSYSGIEGLTAQGKAEMDKDNKLAEVRRTVLGLQAQNADPKQVELIAGRMFPVEYYAAKGLGKEEIKLVIRGLLAPHSAKR